MNELTLIDLLNRLETLAVAAKLQTQNETKES